MLRSRRSLVLAGVIGVVGNEQVTVVRVLAVLSGGVPELRGNAPSRRGHTPSFGMPGWLSDPLGKEGLVLGSGLRTMLYHTD